MAIQFKIKNLSAISDTGVVVAVDCVAYDCDNGLTVTIPLQIPLSPPLSNPIPYNELTQDIVVGWIKDLLGEEVISNYQKALTSKLEKMKSQQLVSNSLPWVV